MQQIFHPIKNNNYTDNPRLNDDLNLYHKFTKVSEMHPVLFSLLVISFITS